MKKGIAVFVCIAAFSAGAFAQENAFMVEPFWPVLLSIACDGVGSNIGYERAISANHSLGGGLFAFATLVDKDPSSGGLASYLLSPYFSFRYYRTGVLLWAGSSKVV